MANSIRWNRSDQHRITKAFKQSAEGKAMVEICAAAYKTALTDGLNNMISSNQGSWKPLSKRYAKAKDSQTKWVKTGRLQKAVTNNAPVKEGTKKGLMFKLDWKTLTGYIIYTGTKRPGITSKQRRAAHFLLNKNRPLFYWSPKNKTNLEKNVQEAINKVFERGGFIVGGNG